MFKYAVSNWIFADEPLEKNYIRLYNAGYEGIELAGEPDRYSPELVNRLSAGYGISVVSVLSWCLWPMEDRDLAHYDPEMKRKAVDYICRNVDFACAVGAPIVVVIPGPAGRTVPHGVTGNPDQWQAAAADEWDRAVDSVRAIAGYAQEKGIIIAVEPINRFESFLLNSAEQGAKFIQEVGMPNIKLHLDTFHMNIEDSGISSALTNHADLVANMHLSDSNRGAIGRGHFDFRSLLETLKRIQYKGALVLEPLPAHPNPFVAGRLKEFRARWDQDLLDSITYLRSLEDEIGHLAE